MTLPIIHEYCTPDRIYKCKVWWYFFSWFLNLNLTISRTYTTTRLRMKTLIGFSLLLFTIFTSETKGLSLLPCDQYDCLPLDKLNCGSELVTYFGLNFIFDMPVLDNSDKNTGKVHVIETIWFLLENWDSSRGFFYTVVFSNFSWRLISQLAHNVVSVFI